MTHIGGEAPHSHDKVHSPHTIHAPVLLPPVKIEIVPGDTVESIKGKSTQKTAKADSPDLAEAQYLLWWASSPSQFTLQSAAGPDLSFKISGANAVLKEQNALLSIGVKVLDAWAKDLHEEAKAIRKELKSDRYQEVQAERGKSGFEAYLNTLTPEQRDKAIHHSRLERLAVIDEGLGKGIGDYLTQIKTQEPALASFAFFMGMLAVGAPMRFDLVSGSQVTVSGIASIANHALPAVVPTYSVEMGAIATMFGVGTAYFAMGQTVAGGVVPIDPNFTNKFAQNYASQVLKTINGSEFNSMAMAMVTAQAAEGEPLAEKRLHQMVNMLKIVLLSSALMLLYKTETGGLSEQEFADLVSGKLQASDIAKEFGGHIRELLATLPKEEAVHLLTGLQAYVATNPKSSDLVNFDAVFAGVGSAITTPEVRG